MQLMLENLQCLLMDASMISILIATVVAISSFLLVLRMSHYYPEYSSYREFLQSLLSGIIIMCGTIAHYTGLRYLAALPRIYVQSGMICYGIISLLHPILPRLSTLRLSFATVRWALRSRSTILDDDVSCDDCQRFDGLSYSRCNVATRSTAVHNLSNPLQFTRYDPDSICIRPGAPLPLVSGLVNTGNSCYLNSVLQVLSSLPGFHAYLERIHRFSSVHPRPIARSLLKVLRLLIRPVYGRASFRAKDVLVPDCQFNGHEQEDAHELFQTITNVVYAEIDKVRAASGLRDILTCPPRQTRRSSIFSIFSTSDDYDLLKDPFKGLLGNQITCMQCGYSKGIWHSPFSNIQLTLPQTCSTTLEACLRQFTDIEYLSDASCRRCSFVETVEKMSAEVAGFRELAKATKVPAERRAFLSEMIVVENQRRELQQALDLDDIENEKYDKIVSRTISGGTSKQAMFARLPKNLCFHLSRTAFDIYGDIYKNNCNIIFPEYLDMTPYCITDALHTKTCIPVPTSTPTNTNQTTYLYRLMGVIVHIGDHDSGHYIAYKRHLTASNCNCKRCRTSNGDKKQHTTLIADNLWYRISDEHVQRCTVDEALFRADAYMLMYEAIPQQPVDLDNLSQNHHLMPELMESFMSLYSEGSIEALSIAHTYEN